ncbi:MAG: phosphoribosylformylglycinamidine synthase [Odoribacteraceae bacterium]|jgi:phosphoribosylformylglycinamidine synthase|nr:phosphoribosylformylglycinamidine synthase [Odoribacteraceae bacterium]
MTIVFYRKEATVYVARYQEPENPLDEGKLTWLFGNAGKVNDASIEGFFVGPRREMITPWSTNAVEITQNMGVRGITRIEEFTSAQDERAPFDPMLQELYRGLDQSVFTVDRQPEPVRRVENIREYNLQEGLALSETEIEYLEQLARKLGRPLTDSEVFGFSQVNSEHCRHKIFNGRFVIDGEEKGETLFALIKKTTSEHPNRVVSAYKDNCAFIEGPAARQFAPSNPERPVAFETRDIQTVISLKAETHNFPTTVEPFNGAATGSGGEIRDRMAGGQASIPLAGTAVYMTAYPHLGDRPWEQRASPRRWLYQTPEEILIKASNGASDFGNKFGQPLITGSLFTFEHEENNALYGYDKVIMLAGGVGYANREQAAKLLPKPGDKVVLLGGDNYRIGMGGGAVSSVDTGLLANAIELNAVQRSNPEMQRRVCNAIRALAEQPRNPIISIHDHGAGGHLNCLSELVEETGGAIHIDQLPVGDPTLSAKEIVGNESQERMGLIMEEKDLPALQRIAERERAPLYVIGEATGDHRFTFVEGNGNKPIDLELRDMFGNPPRVVLEDRSRADAFSPLVLDEGKLEEYLHLVLQIESVACKDWLTNKVDRSVSGRVAHQQCAGPLQLPLNNLGAVTIDYTGARGIATSIGHAPAAALVNPENGSRLAIAEALANLLWAPLEGGLRGVSLSANWMWPARNPGEDARLYRAVEAASRFAIDLGINIPTGKDSLSMTQKYGQEKVLAPGTVIISTVAEVTDVKKIISPVLQPRERSEIIYIDFSSDSPKLGGSALAQVNNKIGDEAPDVKDPAYFAAAFAALQRLVDERLVLAGHDVSSGGMITALLEMCFADDRLGLNIDLSYLPDADVIRILFAENPGVLVQVEECRAVADLLDKAGVTYHFLGCTATAGQLQLKKDDRAWNIDIPEARRSWFKTSYLLDRRQSGEQKARERYDNYPLHPLEYRFPASFTGQRPARPAVAPRAAVIREKGCQCDRETAWMLHLAGFETIDVHMTDLVSGRETLDSVHLIVFSGGFSNSDVLGSAKGWAGAFKYNETARLALERYYQRADTLSLGVCNGCQLMVELGLLYPDHPEMPRMLHNDSHKFESGFVNIDIIENHSVMLHSLAGARLGVWVAHGEGKFHFPLDRARYHIPARYGHDTYPSNPNGSPFAAAAICSDDGRHLAIMPHPERAIHPWNWPYYPADRPSDEVTPWLEALVNARLWIESR